MAQAGAMEVEKLKKPQDGKPPGDAIAEITAAMDFVMADAIAIAYNAYGPAVPKAIPPYNNPVRHPQHDCPRPLTNKVLELLIDTALHTVII